MLRVLFLTDDREDYLADSIIHGLRQLDDVEITDYPRKECLYKDLEKKYKQSLRGGGFTLYGLLLEPTTNIHRGQIWKRLEDGYFNAVIISNIWRQWGIILQWAQLLTKQTLILLDGDDDERYYPKSKSRYKTFGVGTGLRKLLNMKSTHMFKREWTEQTSWYLHPCNMHRTSFAIPEEKIVVDSLNKQQLFPTHIVDKQVASLLGKNSSYAFLEEEDYRRDLSSARFGVTCRRSGWDCLRHYEIAAAGAIPCFRDLTLKPSQCAPHGLLDGINCIAYENPKNLFDRIKNLKPEQEIEIRRKTLDWAKVNTTKKRALEILNESGLGK